MKTILTVAALALVSTAALANTERLGFDGCYVMHKSGAVYPAFCLQGTAEEGISGSGVRLAVFHTNTDEVIKCMRSDASGMTENSFTFIVDEREELVLSNVIEKNGLKEGDITLGRTQLNFSEVGEETTDRLMKVAREACRDM